MKKSCASTAVPSGPLVNPYNIIALKSPKYAYGLLPNTEPLNGPNHTGGIKSAKLFT